MWDGNLLHGKKLFEVEKWKRGKELRVHMHVHSGTHMIKCVLI